MPKRTARVKTHPLNQSVLYKLKSRAKLARMLGYDRNELETLANKSNSYIVFTKSKGIRKPRKIEKPRPMLEAIHRKVFNWLRSIEHPEYLHSGVQGRSYITNARVHVGSDRMFTLDIKQFFPSTKYWHVFDFFERVMHCSRDVAAVLAKLCTANGHVPTGSCLSQEVAFWAHFQMFEAIDDLARSHDLKMTCYVDDITVSGCRANGFVLNEIRMILKRRALASHPDKERVYNYRRPGMVTGSIVTPQGMLLPNNKHRSIHERISEILAMEDSEAKLTMLKKAMGMMVAAYQSDSRFLPRLRTLMQERKRIATAIYYE